MGHALDSHAAERLTDYVNPLLGTATLWEPQDLGYVRTWKQRTWGAEHLAYAGMDDAGEMSSWYVLNAIGLYTYSPADPEYIVTVPLFPRVRITFADGHTTEIRREGCGRKITSITANGRSQKGWFLSDKAFKAADRIVVRTDQPIVTNQQ